jgi:HEAT repeat protein
MAVITLIIILTGFLALLLVLLASWLLLRKARGIIRQRERDGLRRLFLRMFPPLLVDAPDAEQGEESWERAVTPAVLRIQALLGSGTRRRHAARDAAREVLSELGENVAGETRGRISALFERLGFVEEELARLADRRWWVRGEAARRLGLMRSRIGILPLVELLHDPEGDVRSAATQSLIDMAGVEGALRSILQNLSAITTWKEVLLAKRILQAGAAAVGPLLAALESTSPSVRRFAIKMLGELRAPEAVTPLLTRFPRLDDGAKRLALVTLGKSGDQRILEMLEVHAESGSEAARCAAIAGLGYLGAPSTVPKLTRMLSDGPLAVQRAAGEALIRILPAGKTALAETARETTGRPRVVALHYLDLLAIQEQWE